MQIFNLPAVCEKRLALKHVQEGNSTSTARSVSACLLDQLILRNCVIIQIFHSMKKLNGADKCGFETAKSVIVSVYVYRPFLKFYLLEITQEAIDQRSFREKRNYTIGTTKIAEGGLADMTKMAQAIMKSIKGNIKYLPYMPLKSCLYVIAKHY